MAPPRHHRPSARPPRAPAALLALLALVGSAVVSGQVWAAPTAADPGAAATASHLLISEVMTGGASASDEFVELYNPSTAELSLDGLELIYVTASGATITRKASWGPGSAIPPLSHILVANEAGLFAGLADATYANGLSATGGSMALRTIGAAMAIDAVGWGTAASPWLEATPATAPPAGSSLERLPGGELGSGQDTDHNLVDFAVRDAPDPQNSGSPPVPAGTPAPSPSATVEPSSSPSAPATPSATPEPTTVPTPDPTPTASPTSTPTHTVSPTSTPAPLTVAEARALADGTVAVVTGVTLTDSAFSEGGGYLADDTGGLAVLLEGGTFPRGVRLIVSGVIDDRYAQRTIRVDATGLNELGPDVAPPAISVATGSVGEPVEGRLVTISGLIADPPTVLTSGLAFDVDDGSGTVRVLVGPGTGIPTGTWVPGATLGVRGVVGQRDSSGSGSEGYRVQPRDPADVVFVNPPPTPTPSPTATPSPSDGPGDPLVTIDQARRADVGTRLRIRGVVTLPSGLVDPSSAVVADPSGAILVRMGADVGRLSRGQLVELSGTRSTKSGMASLRVSVPPVVLGSQPDPDAVRRPTGAIGEGEEARLITVRGLVGDGPRRSTAGSLSFTVDDGSGPLRVYVAAGAGLGTEDIPAGGWVELRGVVGQQTTGSAPTSGYRLWPRDGADLRVLAQPTGGSEGDSGSVTTGPRPDAPSIRTPVTPTPPILELDRPASSPPATGSADEPAERQPPSPLPIPLAAGLGGAAGLVTLAWRHGTWTRLRGEAARLMEARRRAAWRSGDEEGESYTPPP